MNDRKQLETLRMSLYRIAQTLGIGEDIGFSELVDKCKEDQGWNTLAGDCIGQIENLSVCVPTPTPTPLHKAHIKEQEDGFQESVQTAIKKRLPLSCLRCPSTDIQVHASGSIKKYYCNSCKHEWQDLKSVQALIDELDEEQDEEL
jgi:hypothetical protein